MAWHAEIEKLTDAKTGKVRDNPVCRVLDVRYPGLPNHGDITAIDWTTLARPRALAAGFPCQAVSGAGLQLAEADPRWLWPAVRAGIAALRPEWVAIENVANLVSIQKGELWRGILADLAALGYSVAWGIFGACLPEVGGCHHRHRVFALARLSSTPTETRWTGKACGVPPRRAALLATPLARDGMGRGEGDTAYWEARQERRGSKAGLPLGAQVALLPTPTAQSYGNNQGGAAGRDRPVRHSLESLASAGIVQPQDFGTYTWAVERWAAVHGAAPAPTAPGPRGGVQLRAQFSEWMMGLAPGFVTDVLPRKEALHAIGNGVFPLQAYHAFGHLLPLLTP